jgi:hypothetical protein
MKAGHIILLILGLSLLLVLTNYETISRMASPDSLSTKAPASVASETGFSPWYSMKLPVLKREVNVLILVALGFAVGILGRFFGMMGTWIVTPALNVFGFPMAMAVGTDLTRMTAGSYVTAFRYARREDVGPGLVILFVMGLAMGIELGVRTLLWLAGLDLAGMVIRIVYVIVLLGLSGFIIFEHWKSKRSDAGTGGLTWTPPPEGGTVVAQKLQATKLPPMITLSESGVRISFWTILFIVVISGWFFGLLGVVGGLLLLPAMIYLMGMLPTSASGIDLFSRVFAGTYGCLTYALKGQVEIVAVLWILLGIMGGTQACARVALYVRGQGVRILFALIMVMVGLSVVLRQVGTMHLAQNLLLIAILATCAVFLAKLIHGLVAFR